MSNTKTPKLATLSDLTAACRLATRGYDRVQAVVLGPIADDRTTVWVTTWKVAKVLEAQGYEVMSPFAAATIATN